MNFVSIDSTSITIENVLFDILCHSTDVPIANDFALPLNSGLLDYLRAEAQAAVLKHGEGQWKAIINDLPLLDACLKESFRLNNFISRANIRKVVDPQGLIVPEVGRIPAGANVGFSLWGAHHDERFYQTPWNWRMSRWLESSDKKSVPVFGRGGADDSVGQYLPFGYRRHAW